MISIAKKIKDLRVAKGLSQEGVAERLTVSRPTYLNIENGKRELTLTEAKSLAHILDISMEELIFDMVQVPTNDFGMDKYKQILLNCLKYGGDTSDGRITKTKLAKLAYFADFAWFYENMEPMSGLSYKRLEQGPVPEPYFRAIDELLEDGSIDIENKNATQIIGLTEENVPHNKLSNKELELIKKISDKWKNKSRTEIVEFTHSQIPWKICKPGEIIPYELITQEDPAHVY